MYAVIYEDENILLLWTTPSMLYSIEIISEETKDEILSLYPLRLIEDNEPMSFEIHAGEVISIASDYEDHLWHVLNGYEHNQSH